MLPRIGELLIQRGVVTMTQVEAAIADPRHQDLPLASRLLATGVDEGALAAALSERDGMPGLDLSRSTVALGALDLVPRRVAEGDLFLPVSLEGGRIHLAMSRPLDERVVSEVRFVTGREVSVYVAVRLAVQQAIGAAYEAREAGAEVWRGPRAPADGGLAMVGPGLPEPGVEIVIEPELIPDDGELEIHVEEPEPPPPRADARPLVLVVDDEPDIRRFVQRTLEAKGYAVEVAEDGAAAIARAEALIPDVVLLDAMLPKVHGFEACRRIKASPRTRNVPVVMMTAIYRGWRFAQDARDNYGAEDYVEKPFRLDDLVRRLEAVRALAADRLRAAVDEGGAHLAQGKALLAAGDAAGAVASLAEATRVAPFSVEAHWQLGRAHRARGDLFGAMTAFERAAELGPTHLPTLRALAAIYEEKGFRRKAAEALERALPGASDEARAALEDEIRRLKA